MYHVECMPNKCKGRWMQTEHVVGKKVKGARKSVCTMWIASPTSARKMDANRPASVPVTLTAPSVPLGTIDRVVTKYLSPHPTKNPNRNTITLWQKMHSICHFSPAASKGGRHSTLLIAETQGDPCFFYSNRKQKNLKLGAQLTWCCQKLCQFRLRLYH